MPNQHYKVYLDVNELTGPIQTSVYKAGFCGKSHSVVRIPYTMRTAQLIKGPNGSGNLGGSGSSYYYKSDFDLFRFPNPMLTLMQNRLISKFEGKCGVSSALGSSIFAEGRESVRMAVERLEWAAKLMKAMRRKDVRRLKKVWGKRSRPTQAMKKAGGRWLEFSFGWAPLVQTITSGVMATSIDYPKQRINVSVRETSQGLLRQGVFLYDGRATQFIKLGYDVKVENPNTWLLGRLDLLNPGMWIWEAIPYSFFVDYFINIGDMIHNLDSFAGLSFSNGYTTYYHDWYEDVFHERLPSQRWTSTGTYIRRTDPLPLKRKLVWQQNPLTSSWRRGLNAASFIAQFLGKH